MPTYEASITSPDLAFMRPRLSRWIALGAGSGLTSVAPGTAGTLFAWALWLLMAHYAADWLLALIIAGAFLAGVWACGKTADDLGGADHGAIVWDEIVAFWCVLLLVPAGFGSQFLAFLLFRFFDIVKPPPIRHFDRTLKSGFGIMFDDLLAAGFTVLLFAIWRAL